MEGHAFDSAEAGDYFLTERLRNKYSLENCISVHVIYLLWVTGNVLSNDRLVN